MRGLTVDHNLTDKCQGYVDGSFQEITGTTAVAGAPDVAPAGDLDGRASRRWQRRWVAAVDLGAFEVVPPAVIRMATSGGISRVSWESLSGAVCRVQHAPKLGAPLWTDLPGDVTASGLVVEGADASASNAARRFCRVRALE